ncbi:MAG: DUF6174 domain-containing protein [Treponema sp.]|nr:DUF6174 domain-containing protein [Treponema sp.]
MKNFIFSAVAAVFLLSCAIDDNNSPDITLLYETNLYEYGLWLEQDLRDYSFRLSIDTFPDPTSSWAGTVTVKNGLLDCFIPDEFDDGPDTYNPRYKYKDYYPSVTDWQNIIVPVSDFFSFINTTLPQMTANNYFWAEYDSTWHFPKLYFIGWRQPGLTNSSVGGVSERAINISRFAPGLPPPDDFDSERALWLEQGLQNYAFHLRFSGYGSGSWAGTVTVKNGVLENVEYNKWYSWSEYYYDDSNPDRYSKQNIIVPVTELFDHYDSVRKEAQFAWFNNNEGNAVEMRKDIFIEYDSTWHFPRRCTIYRRAADPLARQQYGLDSLFFINITYIAVTPDVNAVEFPDQGIK